MRQTLLIINLVLATTAMAHAAAPTVGTNGSASREFEPNAARVRFRLFAHGLSASSAIMKLENNQKYLTEKVAAVEKLKPEITFGPIVDHPEKPENFQQQIMIQAMGGQAPAAKKDPRLKRMACTVTLRWNIPDGTLSEKYGSLDEIRLQLDRFGVTEENVEEDDDSRDEALDEKDDGEKPATGKLRLSAKPSFYFVRTLTDEEIDAVAKAAFENGRQKASRLARAAGMSLGNLTSIGDSLGTKGMFGELEDYQRSMISMFGESNETFAEDQNRPAGEISENVLRPLTFTYVVHLQFELN